MRFPKWLTVYGDQSYRGPCAKEDTEQIDSISWLTYNHPTLAAIAVHVKNEGKRSWGQVHYDKLTGSLNKGASDIIIPAMVPFVCEIKRADHTKSNWQKGQLEYLEACRDMGAFVCVALGFDGFRDAVEIYLKHSTKECK